MAALLLRCRPSRPSLLCITLLVLVLRASFQVCSAELQQPQSRLHSSAIATTTSDVRIRSVVALRAFGQANEDLEHASPPWSLPSHRVTRIARLATNIFAMATLATILMIAPELTYAYFAVMLLLQGLLLGQSQTPFDSIFGYKYVDQLSHQPIGAERMLTLCLLNAFLSGLGGMDFFFFLFTGQYLSERIVGAVVVKEPVIIGTGKEIVKDILDLDKIDARRLTAIEANFINRVFEETIREEKQQEVKNAWRSKRQAFSQLVGQH